MKNLLFVTFFFLLTSCGSSSSDDQQNSQFSGEVAEISCDFLSANSCQGIELINNERAKQGIAPLKISNNCQAAAQFHAEDMAEYNYFSHDGRNETWVQRMNRYSVRGFIAENIARAFSPEQAVQSWLNSPPHRRNLLNPNFEYTGMGEKDGYWVQCFSANL